MLRGDLRGAIPRRSRPEEGFDPRLVPKKLLEPLTWASPKTVFVNSLFQDVVPDEYVAAVAEVMLATPWHTYQILTKRADRLQRLLAGQLRAAAEASHIRWGVSVEDRQYGCRASAICAMLRRAPGS